ncbi:hypothetical protein L0Z13_11620 [Burkholderia multivorans]|nr:hypothetical protein [Burkholderia multivorans]UQO04992.1 hypothetical protein L0Z13_11620 [Burkholderia multivorans]
MIIDSLLEFSRAQALTATGASTNIIDLGSDRDIGPGQPLWAVIAVQVAADNTTGDETYSIALQTDDNAAFSSPTTIATVAPAAAAIDGRCALRHRHAVRQRALPAPELYPWRYDPERHAERVPDRSGAGIVAGVPGRHRISDAA